MLKFLIDHNIPKGVADWLIDKGYDVKLVKDINPEMPDQEVVIHALREKRILLTNDNDFVGIGMEKKEGSFIIFRQKSQSADLRIQALEKILPDLQKVTPIGLLILV